MSQQRSSTMFRMTSIVFFFIGAAFIGLGAVFHLALLPIPSTVALHLGIVTVAVVLIDQIWRFCGGQPIDHQIKSLQTQIGRLSQSVDVIESSQAVGLEAVYSRLGSFGRADEWVSLIGAATKQVDLMGRTLLGWTRAAEIPERIADRIVNRDVKFRVLLMSPANKCLATLTEERVNLGSILKDKLTVSIQFFLDIQRSLPAEYQGHLQVRCFDHIPLYCGLVRIDDRFFVTQYLYSASSDNSPFYCAHGMERDWPRTLEKEFEQIWHEAKPALRDEGLRAETSPEDSGERHVQSRDSDERRDDASIERTSERRTGTVPRGPANTSREEDGM